MKSEAWFSAHQPKLKAALAALATREAFGAYEESPSRKHHPQGAREAGMAAFEAHLGKPFEFPGASTRAVYGLEVSPYTGKSLKISYPYVPAEVLLERSMLALPAFRDAGRKARTGVGLQWLEDLAAHGFEQAFATMHTTGQPFRLAYSGSIASALDRGLEALARAWQAMEQVPEEACYKRSFGPGQPVTLRKRWQIRPLGPAVVFSCASFPSWNAWPAVLANLVTGNPVIIKPHPRAILPVAIAVKLLRKRLVEAGFSQDLCQMAVDQNAETGDLIGEEIATHPKTAIIDFTGGQTYGQHLEGLQRKLVFTETSGCNAVILESMHNLEEVMDALAFGLCWFSGQMCTTPQNIFVPESGVSVSGELMSAAQIEQALITAVDRLLATPKACAGILGSLVDPALPGRMTALSSMLDAQGNLLRKGEGYAHPDYISARTQSPMIGRLRAGSHLNDKAAHDLRRREHFGPISFVIRCDDRDHALRLATQDVRDCGAIACYAYSTDPDYLSDLEEAFWDAGASVALNIRRQKPLMWTPAFSDIHVTGANPAGNASLADLAFVASRFRIVQSKIEESV